MKEADFRTELLSRRAKIIVERELLDAQVKALDALLASGMPPEPTAPPEALTCQTTARHASPSNASDAPASAGQETAAVTLSPTAPAAPTSEPKPHQTGIPAMEDHTGRAPRRGRGWLTDRVEQVIAQGGDEFSVKTVLEAYRTKYGPIKRTTTDIIASTVWKVAKRKRYRVVLKGRGTVPTIYSKKPRLPPAVMRILQEQQASINATGNSGQ